MRVLDLFCNAGGAGAGYGKIANEVIGVDINPQPHYPHAFIQADIFDLDIEFLRSFDFIHASPPCQHSAAITKGTNKYRQHMHPNFYPTTLALLERAEKPYALENPDSDPDVVLCGEMFGLGVLRHRKFKLGGWSTQKPAHKPHRGYTRGWRHKLYRDGPYVAVYGKGGGKATVPEAQKAMGIDWTDSWTELVEMIPPAYTEWIANRFMQR